MFYIEEPQAQLRFGDIIRGFVNSTPEIENPDSDISLSDYSILINKPNFHVILTPCCRIKEGTILITPLKKVNPAYFDNEYFEKDLTRINERMMANYSVSSKIWNRFSDKIKQSRLSEGPLYGFVYIFIFNETKYLEQYSMKNKMGKIIETGYYQIDFRDIYRINCRQINSQNQYPAKIKYLQLSIDARNILRDKLASYFYTRPVEDLID